MRVALRHFGVIFGWFSAELHLISAIVDHSAGEHEHTRRRRKISMENPPLLNFRFYGTSAISIRI